MSPIEYSEEMQGYANTVKEGLTEEGIRLPFPNAMAVWKNGKATNKRLSDVTYFGGWSIGADSMDNLTAQLGIGVHSSFTKTTLVSESDNKEYEAYISRSLTIAVCAKRKEWIEKKDDYGRVTSRTSHIQIVALAAELSADKKSFTAWAPIQLTAKGWSAKYIEDALLQWDNATAISRRDFANGIPSQFFWAVTGTFGEQPVTKTVGKGDNNKAITPCQLWLPKEFNEAIITRHFVGAETMKYMADLTKQSEEWREVWANKTSTVATESNEPEAEVTPQDDNIPF